MLATCQLCNRRVSLDTITDHLSTCFGGHGQSRGNMQVELNLGLRLFVHTTGAQPYMLCSLPPRLLTARRGADRLSSHERRRESSGGSVELQQLCAAAALPQPQQVAAAALPARELRGTSPASSVSRSLEGSSAGGDGSLEERGRLDGDSLRERQLRQGFVEEGGSDVARSEAAESEPSEPSEPTRLRTTTAAPHILVANLATKCAWQCLLIGTARWAGARLSRRV